jgi:hypothetical protein
MFGIISGFLLLHIIVEGVMSPEFAEIEVPCVLKLWDMIHRWTLTFPDHSNVSDISGISWDRGR